MSLVFAAITPHPPLLIPAIGKEKLETITNTKKAMDLLAGELYLAKPNVIIIISPHSSIFPDAFSVNAHTHFVSSFETFGDLATKKDWAGAPDLAASVSHKANSLHVPIQQVSQEGLDHGAAVALYCLTDHLPDVKVLPIGYSALTKEDHIRFGELLKEVIMNEDKRVAVIASGDLSHCLTQDSPAGYKAAGKKFDETLIQNLESGSFDSLVGLDDVMVKEAEECVYRSLLILLGVVRQMNVRFSKYSYECPLGVGYLVGNFSF